MREMLEATCNKEKVGNCLKKENTAMTKKRDMPIMKFIIKGTKADKYVLIFLCIDIKFPIMFS
jgi:hypothetical protein